MEQVQAKIEAAMASLATRRQLIYDPRLLDGYDGYMGPLDHRRQLRVLLAEAMQRADRDLVIESEISCEPIYKRPRRKRGPKITPMVDLVIEVRQTDPYTRKRTVDRYAVVVAFAVPAGDGEEGALTISRHGKSGKMPSARADDTGYCFQADVGNVERWVRKGDYKGGFVLLYSVYDGWKADVDPFFPHDGELLEGTLQRPKTLQRKSTPAVELDGTYPVSWTHWSTVPQTAPPGERSKRGDTVDVADLEVKYLLVSIAGAES